MTSEQFATLLQYLLPAIGALTGLLVIGINAFGESIKAKMKDRWLDKYIDRATDMIETAVIAVNQTYTDAIKNTDAWTPEAQAKAFQMAKEQAILIMGENARKAIKDLYGDMDAWVSAKVEMYVNKNKTPTE